MLIDDHINKKSSKGTFKKLCHARKGGFNFCDTRFEDISKIVIFAEEGGGPKDFFKDVPNRNCFFPPIV